MYSYHHCQILHFQIDMIVSNGLAPPVFPASSLYDGDRGEEKAKNNINFTGTNSFTFECQNKYFAQMNVVILEISLVAHNAKNSLTTTCHFQISFRRRTWSPTQTVTLYTLYIKLSAQIYKFQATNSINLGAQFWL